MNAKLISVIDALVSNGSKWKSSTQAIRTSFLETILITSFLIATLLIIIPYQYKNGNRVPTVIFNGIPSTAFHGFVVSLLYAFTGSLIALLIHDNTSCSFLAKFCECLAMVSMTSALSLLLWAMFTLIF
ncbi:hypothetical protein ACSBR2_011766 [Camellia fascicularis]